MKSNHSLRHSYFSEIKAKILDFFSRPQPAQTQQSTAVTPKSKAFFQPMIGLESLEARPALLLSRSDALTYASEWIVDAGFWVAHSQCLQHELQSMIQTTQKWSVILIAIDDFGGITAVIEDLLRLRRALPGVPVILLSSEVHGDDFSSVRKHLCDVTLRLPLSLPRLNLGLCEAVVNNAEWVEHTNNAQARPYALPLDHHFNEAPQYEAV